MRELNLDHLKWSNQTHTDLAKAKISAANKGRKHTDLAKAKISAFHKGRPRTEAQLAGMKKDQQARSDAAIKWQGKTLNEWAELLQMDKAGLWRHIKVHGHLLNVKKYQSMVDTQQ